MKYNQKVKTVIPTVINKENGRSFKYDPKTELVAILASGMENKFYEKESEREKRLTQLINEVASKDIDFAAKAMVYYRSVVGQRSVTQFGAAILAKHLSGTNLGSKFYTKRSRNENKGGIVYRLDDMFEIAACYMAKNPSKRKRKDGTPTLMLPNAIKKGFKLAIEAADKYELAKYQAKGSAISLVDIFNLVHPVPRNEEMKKVFKDLIEGKLKQFNTVEDKNTKVGQEVADKVKSGKLTKTEAAVVLQEAKEDNYAELIKTRKIGYLALLRNLRNILKNTGNTSLIDEACKLLTDVKLIKQSLVFPHQIDIALEIMLLEFSPSQMAKFAGALNKAYELAIPNLTELFTNGRTAVVIDTSGSMSGGSVNNNGKVINAKPLDKAALIGATLSKGINADLYQFSTTCREISFNPNDSVNTIKNKCIKESGKVGHGTNFNSIFENLKGKYDRIFIISDLQGGDYIIGNSEYTRYINKHGQPFIYTIDLQGYGTTMFKPNTNKLIQLFGYGADIYEYVKVAEIDPKIVLKAIEAIVI